MEEDESDAGEEMGLIMTQPLRFCSCDEGIKGDAVVDGGNRIGEDFHGFEVVFGGLRLVWASAVIGKVLIEKLKRIELLQIELKLLILYGEERMG